MRAGGAGDGVRSSHTLDLLGQDLDGDANLARAAMRVALLAGVLLRQRVDVRVGALLGHLDDPAADLDVAVGVVGILDRERDLRAALEVLVLHPSACRVEDRKSTRLNSSHITISYAVFCLK